MRRVFCSLLANLPPVFSRRPDLGMLCVAEQNQSSPSEAMHWGGLQVLLSKRSATSFLGRVSSSLCVIVRTNGVAQLVC